MFTGIITSLGILKKIDGHTFTFSHNFDEALELGESVAVNGMCVTVTEHGADFFTADIIEESRRLTVFGDVKIGTKINLERSAQIGDRNSGHHVSGHIDETGKISLVEKKSDFWLVRINFSEKNWSLVIHKGSIAIDGISLTISAVSEDAKDPWLEVSIIPHTWEHTNLSSKKNKDPVNLEFDQLGKYVQKMMNKNQ
jgi:riboflavin synthase